MTDEIGQEREYHKKESHLTYSVQQFEGPLDLLLHLIQKAQVSIYAIPIAEITDQFLIYLEMAKKVDLDDLTDFYHMAAHLLYIKSNTLLPREVVDDLDWEQDKQDLVEQLIEYQKYKKYSTLLAEQSNNDQLFIMRKKNQFMLPFRDEDLWNEISVWDLLKTFSSLLQTITLDQVFNVYEEVTVKQKLTLMRELFDEREFISFIDIVINKNSVIDIICAFLAILEAVKFNMIIIEQHTLFGDILIKKSPNYDSEDQYIEELPYTEEVFNMASNGIKEKLEEIEIDNDDDIIIDFNDEDE